MNCTTTYSNCKMMQRSIEAKNEAFHKRLKQMYPCVEDVSDLPKSWSHEAKAGPIGLTFDELGCYFRGSGRREEEEKISAAVRTDNSIPASCLIYYYEIKFVSKGREGQLGIGLATAKPSLTKLPGYEPESYGYHGDDGLIYVGQNKGHSYGPTFTTGDVIGCGINLVENKIFFTKNGLNLGYAFEDVPSSLRLYPIVAMRTAGEEIRANFGQEEFIYDIEQDLRSLRKNMTFAMSNFPVSDFSEWQTTLHKLVQSWLLQNSYPNTAEAFTKSTKIESKDSEVQRIHQRNKIQQCVLSGRISEAIRLTNLLCPYLLQNNPNLLFALRCRQFIELIVGADNDYQIQLTPTTDNVQHNDHHTHHEQCDNSNTSNGNGDSNHNDLCKGGDAIEADDVEKVVYHNGHNMIDEQPMDGDDLDSETKFTKLIEFGRELNNQCMKLEKLYGRNEANDKMLHDAIGLIAFTDPKSSNIGKILLDPSERESISQLLNTSIVKAEMGCLYRAPLEEVMDHLCKLVKLNDSQGRWLLDKLYLRLANTPSTPRTATNSADSSISSTNSSKKRVNFIQLRS